MDLEAKERMRRFFFSKKKNCGLRKTRAGGPSNSESNWCGLRSAYVSIYIYIEYDDQNKALNRFNSDPTRESLGNKLEKQTSSRNSRVVLKDYYFKKSKQSFKQHPQRCVLKEAWHFALLRDFNRHLLGNSHKIWGNAKLVLH